MIEFNSSFFLQLINFLVLILILHLLLFKPILKNLNKRNDLIRSLKEDSESLNKKTDRLVEEYNVSIATAKKESIDIINKAKAEAVTEQNRIISDAKEKFKEMVDDAKKQIQAETETASLKLKEGAEPLSRLLAKKVLGRDIN